MHDGGRAACYILSACFATPLSLGFACLLACLLVCLLAVCLCAWLPVWLLLVRVSDLEPLTPRVQVRVCVFDSDLLTRGVLVRIFVSELLTP